MPEIIQKNVPLAPYTTLAVGGSAEYFVAVETIEELRTTVLWARSMSLPITVIGGGSNILVSDSGMRGLVIHNRLGGITFDECESHVQVVAGSGVVLDSLVEELVTRELWGLENLSGIPGTVGGVPIQNVGAYGVEARDVILSVEVYDVLTNELVTLSNETCAFAYRDSLFKHAEGKKYIVTRVTFRVQTEVNPKITYADLARRFADVAVPSLRQIREAVCEIRKNKFPDWRILGTAGSFFKNPRVDSATATLLRLQYPELPLYKEGEDTYKLALGWILDRVLSLKGFREGNIGLYEHQALVLVNHGGATSDEVYAFSERIIKKIFDAIHIRVEREVVVLK